MLDRECSPDQSALASIDQAILTLLFGRAKLTSDDQVSGGNGSSLGKIRRAFQRPVIGAETTRTGPYSVFGAVLQFGFDDTAGPDLAVAQIPTSDPEAPPDCVYEFTIDTEEAGCGGWLSFEAFLPDLPKDREVMLAIAARVSFDRAGNVGAALFVPLSNGDQKRFDLGEAEADIGPHSYLFSAPINLSHLSLGKEQSPRIAIQLPPDAGRKFSINHLDVFFSEVRK